MKYRGKPAIIEACRWTGDNFQEIKDFVWSESLTQSRVRLDEAGELKLLAGVEGASGYVNVPVGDWVARADENYSDHWPIEADYFSEKYSPLRQREGDQPLPESNENPVIQELVMDDLNDRLELGISRYGTGLQAHNGRDMLKDAYDEAMDLVVYLRGALYERDQK